MPSKLYIRIEDESHYSLQGESEYTDPVSALLDVSSRESGEPPTAGEQWAVLDVDEDTITVLRVEVAPEIVVV